MKGSIFIPFSMLFLLLGLASATAQIGVKVGLGVSDIVFRDEGQTPYLDYEINSLEHKLPKISYQFGVVASFEVTNHIDFQPALLFVSQGLDYSTKYLFDDITYKINSNYLQLPLLFKYRTSVEKNKLSGFVFGPYASVKLSANKIIKIGGEREKNPMTNIRQTDFGLIAGYTFDFNLASKKMLLELSSSYSLFDMMDRIDGYIPMYNGPEDEYARNASIWLSVEYRFNDLITKKKTEK